MTTATDTAVVDHTSDAGFRAWGSGFAALLAAAGMVQAADSGQINWTTVTRPGVSTAGGYEIWHNSDSSMFLKLEYGTGTGTTIPQMWVTAGTGSNGSGTITGQTNTRAIWTSQNVPNSTATTYTTYMCATTNAFAVAWKVNGFSGAFPLGYLVIGKSVDGAGAATSTGIGVLRSGSNGGTPTLQSVRQAATAVTFTDSVNFCVIPGNPSASLVGADIQAYQTWLNLPNVVPFAWCCAYVLSEITRLNTFPVAMVGAVSHTYLALGQLGSSGTINGQAAATYGLGMIYE